jgi:hypothetical protein
MQFANRLAFLLHQSKKIIINKFFNGFNIFEAYYAGMESGRITRIALKLIFFFLILFIAKSFYGSLSSFY